MHPPERFHVREREQFDPVAEGARHGLSAARSLEIWERVIADAASEVGRYDEDRARRRFHGLAMHVAVGGERFAVVGKATRVGVEHDPAATGEVTPARAMGWPAAPPPLAAAVMRSAEGAEIHRDGLVPAITDDINSTTSVTLEPAIVGGTLKVKTGNYAVTATVDTGSWQLDLKYGFGAPSALQTLPQVFYGANQALGNTIQGLRQGAPNLIDLYQKAISPNLSALSTTLSTINAISAISKPGLLGVDINVKGAIQGHAPGDGLSLNVSLVLKF
jgi:hypothetical protein